MSSQQPTQVSPTELFAGSRRRDRYDEPADAPPYPAGDTRVRAVEGRVVPPGLEVVPFEPSPRVEEASGLKRFLAKLGLGSRGGDEQEAAELEDERVIRQSTWTRAMNVFVANPGDGSGKASSTVIAAGILASIRGGYIAGWEASDAPGDLTFRAEGNPPRGLAEMLAGSGTIRSAGNLSGYTAPQTSHAAIVGTVGPRGTLSAEDIHTARRLFDAYYHVSLCYAGDNPMSDTYIAAMDTADAALLPCVVDPSSIRGVQAAVQAMTTRASEGNRHAAGLAGRTVVVVGHDGGPEDPELAATVVECLRRDLPVAAVMEVPFDPVVRRGGEISLDDLTLESRRAWKRVGRHLVEALQGAPASSPIPPARTGQD